MTSYEDTLSADSFSSLVDEFLKVQQDGGWKKSEELKKWEDKIMKDIFPRLAKDYLEYKSIHETDKATIERLEKELQEANTKLTMYEARHETDKGTIEQLKEAQEAFDTYNYSTHEVGKLKN